MKNEWIEVNFWQEKQNFINSFIPSHIMENKSCFLLGVESFTKNVYEKNYNYSKYQGNYDQNCVFSSVSYSFSALGQSRLK